VSRRAAAVAAAGLLGGWLLAEVLIRLFFPHHASGLRLNRYVESERGKFCRYDAMLGWDGTPDAADRFVWEDSVSGVRQNRHGYRGTAHPYERTGTRRLVVLGDSFVWGFGVDDEDVFTRRLERDARPALEVVNLGVSGYGTDQELLLWRNKGRQWRPDDVLLLVTFYTDIYDNVFTVRYNYPKPAFVLKDGRLTLVNVPVPPRAQAWDGPAVQMPTQTRPWLGRLIDASATVGLTAAALSRRPAVRRFLEDRGVIPRLAQESVFNPAFYRPTPDATTEACWRVMAALLRTLNEDVRSSGARLTIAYVPHILQVYPDLWEAHRLKADAAGEALDVDAPNRRLTEIGRELGADVLDLTPPLRLAGRRDRGLYFPVNLHWTASGHRVVADVLAEWAAFTASRPAEARR
jgi:lysophospholipase L1-like esterase